MIFSLAVPIVFGAVIAFFITRSYFIGKLRRIGRNNNEYIRCLLEKRDPFEIQAGSSSTLLCKLSPVQKHYCIDNKGDHSIFCRYIHMYLRKFLNSHTMGTEFFFKLQKRGETYDPTVLERAKIVIGQKDSQAKLFEIFDKSYEMGAKDETSLKNFLAIVKSPYFTYSELYPYFYERLKEYEEYPERETVNE